MIEWLKKWELVLIAWGFAVLKSGERSVGQSFHRQTQRTVEGTLRFDSHCPKLVVPLLPIRTN
jgi:hypothetical protein